MTQDSLRVLVIEAALVFAGLSFVVYFAYSFGWLKTAAQKAETEVKAAAAAANGAAAAASPQEVIDLVKAVGGLAESLAKAGPGLWSMVGAVLFLLVASFASGVFQAVS